MPFTASDLATLDAAIASGELMVQQGDTRVQYRSMAELQAARAFAAGQVAKATARPPRQFRVNVEKGI